MPTLGQDLTKLGQLKAKATKATAAAKKATEDRDKWIFHCYQRMEAEETGSQKVRDKLYVSTSTEYGTVQDRSAFVAWAKENEPDLVTEKEQGGLLNALVRQCLADGQELPPGVGFYTKDNVSVRKAS